MLHYLKYLNFLFYSILDLKPAVACQPLNKPVIINRLIAFYFTFDALDSVASSNVWAGKILRILIGEHKIQVNFQSGGNPGWNYGTELKEVVINKVFYLGHYKNIKKIRKTINPILETVQLCTSKHSTERSQE